MKIESTHGFIKIFKKRFRHKPNIQEKFDQRVRLFAENSTDQLLQDHPLSGKLQGYRAFSITGDIRAIYYISNETAYLVDREVLLRKIGTHNQVYGK